MFALNQASEQMHRQANVMYVRLTIKTDTRSSKVITDVRVQIKNLNLKMSNHSFDGTDPIPVLDFLDSIVNDADMLNMLEAQAFIAFQKILAYPAEMKFCTNLSGASHHGGITCWLKTIQYLH